jgi:hypothetical protein
MPEYDFRHLDNITTIDKVGSVPRNEQEELEARQRITTAVLVAWYIAEGIPLGVSLRNYVSGES